MHAGESAPPSPPTAPTRNGREIYQSFRDGLASPECDASATSARWRKQFAHAPTRLATAEDETLALFGYVVDELRAAGLPTEFALIPFVESSYRPDARNRSGPTGLWQLIGSTARNHDVTVHERYDGRLSPVDSTQAAVRYLRTLYGTFGGNWQLAVMAYNAGESRILQAMRRSGGSAAGLRPAQLAGMSPVTYAYVEKLHALSCVLENTGDHDRWLASLDRPVTRLTVQTLPRDASALSGWARDNGHDPGLLARLNPALKHSLWRGTNPLRLLAPVTTALPLLAGSAALSVAGKLDKPAPSASPLVPAAVATAVPAMTVADAGEASVTAPALPSAISPTIAPRVPQAQPTHTVRSGESAWSIARQHGLDVSRLLSLNGLDKNAKLKPGMVLKLRAE